MDHDEKADREVTSRTPIQDLRSDPASFAEAQIIRDAEGLCITNSNPPRSIADAQEKTKGYDPTVFFDPVNAEKQVPSVSHPLGPDVEILSSREDRIRAFIDHTANEKQDNALDQSSDLDL